MINNISDLEDWFRETQDWDWVEDSLDDGSYRSISEEEIRELANRCDFLEIDCEPDYIKVEVGLRHVKSLSFWNESEGVHGRYTRFQSEEYHCIYAVKLEYDWDIRRDGHSFSPGSKPRYDLTPEKWEMIGGKLLTDEIDRYLVLGMLLENMGVDRAVRYGEIEVWEEAISKRKAEGSL